MSTGSSQLSSINIFLNAAVRVPCSCPLIGTGNIEFEVSQVVGAFCWIEYTQEK